MKRLLSPLSFLSIFLLSLLIIMLFLSPVQAKKRCKPLLEKLHNVQAMQRNGHSLKRGQSLRKKEDKARNKWWQCEHSSRYAKNKSKNKRKKKSINRKNKKIASYKKNKIHSSKKVDAILYSENNPIVIKSKYQGDKKFSWLEFYQQPVKCQRPKNLTTFAACSEDKQAQQLVFEQQYNE